MKIINTKICILSVLFISFIFIGGCENKQNNIADETKPIVDDTNKKSETALSQQDVSGLVRMREEEKLSRDTYNTLGNKWKNKTFIDVAKVEQLHMNAVKVLLEKYGIDDPVRDDSVGVFSSFAIKKLYDDSVSQGNKSLLDAFVLAADAEALDILDLNDLAEQLHNPDIIAVYNTLIVGSRNHLRSYVKNIKNNGGNYKPKYISQEVYNGIISSQDEK